MVQDHHEAEDLADVPGGELVLVLLEEGHEHTFHPVGVEPLLLHVALEGRDDGGGGELPDPALHELVELGPGLGREELLEAVVVGDEDVLEVLAVQVVDVLLDLGVHLLPERGVAVPQLLHQEVERHDRGLLDPVEVVPHSLQGFAHPLVFVPVVLLLPLHFRQALQALDQLLEAQVLGVLEGKQDLVGLQSVPVDLRTVVHEEFLAQVELVAIPDGHADGESEGGVGQIGGPDARLEFELVGELRVVLDALVGGLDLPGFLGEGEVGGERESGEHYIYGIIIDTLNGIG